MVAAGPSRGQSSSGVFADEVVLELGQGGELAVGGGVDRLLEAAEPDPAVGELGNGGDQMP